MSYPFSVYPLPSYKPQVMMPSEVDQIVTSGQCRELANTAKEAAMIRAAAFNDPRYYQFAESFNVFANADQASIKHYSNNRTTLEYIGGCDLLDSEDTRKELWSYAKERLREETTAWHNDTGSVIGGQSKPTLNCFSQNTAGQIEWRC
jgi:hypothetical protein